MAVTRDPIQWREKKFPRKFIPTILHLAMDCWSTFSKPHNGERETKITRRFVCALRQARNLRRLPFVIDREEANDDPKTAEELGRIDLRLIPRGYTEEVYFAFECKKMNVRCSRRWRSQASEYVEEGIRRFITGKYAAGLDDGGMIAYVMDGNVAKAIGAVEKSMMRSSCLRLCDKVPLLPSRILPATDCVKESRHDIRDPAFCIHHVFLAV